MSRMQRDKGRRAEAEVAAIYTRHGYAVRGLEGRGDHLAVRHGLVIHSEVKRQEVLRLPLWSRQALAEAPEGAIPVVAFRRNHERWSAIAPAELVEEALERAEAPYALAKIGARLWVRCDLAQLAEALAWRHHLAPMAPEPVGGLQ